MTRPLDVAKEISKIKVKKKFIFTSFIGGTELEPARNYLQQNNISNFETPERAIISFLKVANYKSKSVKMAKTSLLSLNINKDVVNAIINKARLEKRKQLSEDEAKDILAAYGVPILPYGTASSELEAIELAEKLSYPVVMKILSPDILHKIDCGGVELNITNQEEVKQAYKNIMTSSRQYHPAASLEGVYMEPMIAGDLELIIGVSFDPVLGAMMMFGRGGSEVEIHKDISFGILPLTINEIVALIKETRVYERIKGYRNMPGLDIKKLAELIYRVSLLSRDFGIIKELDINPLLVNKGEMTVLDAKIVLK